MDERGTYKAHVEDSVGKIIYEISNEDEEGNTSPLWLIEDGFIKNTRDMGGLAKYLSELKIMETRDRIIYIG